jgi:hypothetical protein
MKQFPTLYVKNFLLMFCLLTACTPAQTSSTSGNIPTVEVVPTSVQIISITPTATATSSLPGDKNMKIITLDQKSQTISLNVGESFLLNLGENIYQWDVTSNDPDVISRVVNVMVIKGAQGIYEAHKIGKTTITASGNPLCREAKPPCGMPSIIIAFNIEVIA